MIIAVKLRVGMWVKQKALPVCITGLVTDRLRQRKPNNIVSIDRAELVQLASGISMGGRTGSGGQIGIEHWSSVREIVGTNPGSSQCDDL